MQNLLQFPLTPSNRVQIPQPVNYKPGDDYLLMEFSEGDTVPAGFFSCVKFFIRKAGMVDGLVHAIATPDGTALSTLRHRPDGKVEAVSYLEGSPEGVFEEGELAVLGFIEEVWPDGWQGGRWTWNRAASMEGHSYRRPLLNLKL